MSNVGRTSAISTSLNVRSIRMDEVSTITRSHACLKIGTQINNNIIFILELSLKSNPEQKHAFIRTVQM